MRRLLKNSLIAIALFSLVWTIMISIWRRNNHMPATQDLVVDLLVLPICLLLGLWFINKLVAKAKSNTAILPAAESSQPAETSDESEKTAELEQKWELFIAAGALKAFHGNFPEEVLEQMRENNLRLPLDPELTNQEGFPIMTGRIPDYDEEKRSAFLSFTQASEQETASWREEDWRALSFGCDVIVQLMQTVTAHALLTPFITATTAKRAEIALPTLQILPIYPVEWSESRRSDATKFFLHIAAQQGWPSEKLLPSPIIPISRIEPLSVIDRLNVHTHRQSLPCFSLVVAIESHIGEVTIRDWENAGLLQNARRKDGLIPGEGAAGILLVDNGVANHLAGAEITLMRRPTQTAREKPVDAAGRINAAALTESILRSASLAATADDMPGLVVTDTDQRSNRTAEMINAIQTAFPDLDINEQCIHVAAQCGHAGAVSTMTALVIAHQHVTAQASPAFCLSNRDPVDRGAIVLLPRVTSSHSTSEHFSGSDSL